MVALLSVISISAEAQLRFIGITISTEEFEIRMQENGLYWISPAPRAHYGYQMRFRPFEYQGTLLDFWSYSCLDRYEVRENSYKIAYRGGALVWYFEDIFGQPYYIMHNNYGGHVVTLSYRMFFNDTKGHYSPICLYAYPVVYNYDYYYNLYPTFFPWIRYERCYISFHKKPHRSVRKDYVREEIKRNERGELRSIAFKTVSQNNNDGYTRQSSPRSDNSAPASGDSYRRKVTMDTEVAPADRSNSNSSRGSSYNAPSSRGSGSTGTTSYGASRRSRR